MGTNTNSNNSTTQEIYNKLCAGKEIKILFADKFDALRLRNNLQGIKRRTERYLAELVDEGEPTSLNMSWEYDTIGAFGGTATFRIQFKKFSMLTYIIEENKP